ncbi:MAG: histidine phosphatase family protein [Pseudomonadota bacterium]
MKRYPDIYVLRHGETEWNAEGRMQGDLNSPLTVRGIEHARAQRRILERRDLTGFEVRVSPLGRAIETAGIAVAPLVRSLTTDPALREIGVGDWAGCRRDELSLDTKAMQVTEDGVLALYQEAPGGEGFDGLAQRCEGVLDALQGPSILVTHGITSRMLRALYLGLGPEGLHDLPGGQGVVYFLSGDRHDRLTDEGR